MDYKWGYAVYIKDHLGLGILCINTYTNIHM